jgi:hypothetical protein
MASAVAPDLLAMSSSCVGIRTRQMMENESIMAVKDVTKIDMGKTVTVAT